MNGEYHLRLWHCPNSRSLRPLWALEEMGLNYDLMVLPFPPRVHQKDFLSINSLGTVPYLIETSLDREVQMTESVAICQYLAERFSKDELLIKAAHPEYGDYLNWLYMSDATYTFPQSIIFRYSLLEQGDRKQPQVAEDYMKFFFGRLRKLDAHMENRQYLCDGRFTIADIAIGFSLFFGEYLGIENQYSEGVKEYLFRLKQRPAFQRAICKE